MDQHPPRLAAYRSRSMLAAILDSIRQVILGGSAMKDEPSFDYKKCRWASGDPDKNRRWYDELESQGPENVRARLSQTNAGSRENSQSANTR